MQLRGCLYGTSTIQGHEKTSVEQDKLKIPLPAILLQSATAIFYQVRWLPYYKITTVLQNATSIIIKGNNILTCRRLVIYSYIS